MGTDIHAAIEYRESADSPWVARLTPNRYFGQYPDEPEFSAHLRIGRNYDLFAILANVRNGKGFGGCLTSEKFVFISDNRGLPEDISDEARAACDGDHSETWVSLREILAYDWTQAVTHYGVVNAQEFAEWERRKSFSPGPSSYCGNISGANIKHITEDQMRAYVTLSNQAKDPKLDTNLVTQISWLEQTAEAGARIWTEILPHMLKLASERDLDDVRLIMNFDS